MSARALDDTEQNPQRQEEQEKGKSSATATASQSNTRKAKGKSDIATGSTAAESSVTSRREQNREYQQQFRKRKQEYEAELRERSERLLEELEHQKAEYERLLLETSQRNQALRSIVDSLVARTGQEALQETAQTLGLSVIDIERLIAPSTSSSSAAVQHLNVPTRERERSRSLYLPSSVPTSGSSSSSSGPFVASPVDTSGISSHWLSLQDASISQRSSEKTSLSSLEQSRLFSGHSPSSSRLTTTNLDPAISFGQVGNNEAMYSTASTVVGSLPPALPPDFPTLPWLEASSTAAPQPGGQQVGRQEMLPYSMYSHLDDPRLGHSYPNLTPDTAHLQEEMQLSLAALETIERVNRYAAMLQNNSFQHLDGRAKDDKEYARVVDGLSQLIRHIEDYRRSSGMGSSSGTIASASTAPIATATATATTTASSSTSSTTRTAYPLPQLLRPTRAQQVTPHDALIDALPFATLRHNIVRHQQSLPLDNVFVFLIFYLSITPGSSAVVESNWHLDPDFYNAFPRLM